MKTSNLVLGYNYVASMEMVVYEKKAYSIKSILIFKITLYISSGTTQYRPSYFTSVLSRVVLVPCYHNCTSTSRAPDDQFNDPMFYIDVINTIYYELSGLL